MFPSATKSVFIFIVAVSEIVFALPTTTVKFEGVNIWKYIGTMASMLIEGDIVPPVKEKNSVTNEENLWPEGKIFYHVNESMDCPLSYQCLLLQDAIKEYHEKTCVRFIPWSGEPDYVEIFVNPDSEACWSSVGRQGGKQLVSLGAYCWYKGIFIHELGHVIGFWHEMNRPDRDLWVDILWENILPKFQTSFKKYTADIVNSLGEQFDYSSVMMYDEYAFSRDEHLPTILPVDRRIKIGPLWAKNSLSNSDVRRINKLYKCFIPTS